MSPRSVAFTLLLVASLLASASPPAHAGSPAPDVVKDIYPGTWSSEPKHLTYVDGTLFFIADDGIHGYELWKSDGTPEGTILVKDIWPGAYPTEFYSDVFVAVGDSVVFGAEDGVHGEELWVSDGTAEGTFMLRDVSSSMYTGPEFLAAADGMLYFTEEDEDHGSELWRTDGTPEGTILVKDINPGPRSSELDRNSFTFLGQSPFFYANDGVHGCELWRTDGTTQGTVLVKDVASGALGSGSGYYYCQMESVALGDVLFFAPFVPEYGRELWKSDGTAAGTVLVKDVRPGPDPENGSDLHQTASIGSTLFFVGNDGVHGEELWKSDGTSEGTKMVKDIGEPTARPRLLGVAGDRLVFSTHDGVHGIEPWVSDGTAKGTALLMDINPGYDGSGPETLAEMDGVLYFNTYGYLWRTEGTLATTSQVTEPPYGRETWLLGMGDGLFWWATESVEYPYVRCSLWKSDGTPGGTHFIKGTLPYSSGRVDEDNDCLDTAAVVPDALFFRDADAEHGRELWAARHYRPIAGLTATNDSPTVLGDSTTFTATVTAGNYVTYTWDLDDGAVASGVVITHTYAAAGVYTATVTASNALGQASASTTTTVVEPRQDVYLPILRK